MTQSVKRAKVDLEKKRDEFASEFCKAGIRYIAALDEWALANAQTPGPELQTARERIRLLETSLHRLFPDEFADTNSAAE